MPEEKVYSQEQVERMVQDALMANRQDALERRLLEQAAQFERHATEIKASIDRLHADMSVVKSDLRQEIERDFMTKAEGEALAAKIDNLRNNLRMAAATIIAASALVQWLVDVWLRTNGAG